jgi:hypothetical protein
MLREWGSFSLYLQHCAGFKGITSMGRMAHVSEMHDARPRHNLIDSRVSYFGVRFPCPEGSTVTAGSSNLSFTDGNAGGNLTSKSQLCTVDNIGDVELCISLEPGLMSIFQQNRLQFETLYSTYVHKHDQTVKVPHQQSLSSDDYLTHDGITRLLLEHHVPLDAATTKKCFEASRSGGSAPPGYISYPEFLEFISRIAVVLSVDITVGSLSSVMDVGDKVGSMEINLRRLMLIMDKDSTLFPENVAALKNLERYFCEDRDVCRNHHGEEKGKEDPNAGLIHEAKSSRTVSKEWVVPPSSIYESHDVSLPEMPHSSQLEPLKDWNAACSQTEGFQNPVDNIHDISCKIVTKPVHHQNDRGLEDL